MTLPEVLTAIRRSAVLVLVLLVACVGASALYVALQTPEYESTARVFVATGRGGDASADLTFAQQAVGSYAELATTPYILDAVSEQLELPQTGEQLAEDVTATVENDQLIISITATATSPAGAAAIANAAAEQLIDGVRALTPTTPAADLPVTLTPVQDATEPTRAARPAVLASLLAGLIAGIVLGLAAAIVRARTDTRVRDARQLETAFDRPVLGVTPSGGPQEGGAVVALKQPASAGAEAYRALRTNLQFLNADEDVDSIVVTSALPGEGKSTTVLNLGVVAANAERRVLIVDADLRKPRIARYAGIDGSLGLTDVLIGRTSLEDAVQEWGPEGLSVLPAGTEAPNAGELLQSKAMTALMEQVREQYDLVLLDSPPLTAVNDAALLARLTSGALVAVALGRTRGPQAEAAVDALRKAQASVLGFVATFSRAGSRSAYPYDEPARPAAKATVPVRVPMP